MTVSSTRVEGVVRAIPAEVFDHVAAHHFENHPRWDPDVLEMRQTSPGPVGVGTTAVVVLRQGRGVSRGIADCDGLSPGAVRRLAR